MNINRETFQTLTQEQQLLALFDALEDVRRLLRKRTVADKALTAATGFIGGIAAVAGKWFFLRG